MQQQQQQQHVINKDPIVIAIDKRIKNRTMHYDRLVKELMTKMPVPTPEMVAIYTVQQINAYKVDRQKKIDKIISAKTASLTALNKQRTDRSLLNSHLERNLKSQYHLNNLKFNLNNSSNNLHRVHLHQR
ncbi:hypothetical protein SAMD00019534_099430 [Acytostelium subglobosum LB1]|uniref:hypothetical protein n=1 Tax=Acytostelium subglobosum LB1 TaxID=1410327 RepID=UPI0006449ABA|nr:hypothetical protein SAMD00019534_099430 [Acytostelium subglobosum LB1]GAM26768.1 hypothetical protein SAMD00019534_099430 [Acytostelium subglobosum LB1]|eukprot:XP_012750429.1 hypothetical protein SAMD00019534_099430 [Acytostelium subglobosum LB1]